MIELHDQEGRAVSVVLNKTEELDYTFLRSLHNLARRSALKVDDALDAMLKSLNTK